MNGTIHVFRRVYIANPSAIGEAKLTADAETLNGLPRRGH